MLNRRFGLAFLFTFASVSITKGNTYKLDYIAAHSGIVLGNSVFNLFLGDEAFFDAVTNIAYSTYLAKAFRGKYE